MAQQPRLGLFWRIHDTICPAWRFQWKAIMKINPCCRLRPQAHPS